MDKYIKGRGAQINPNNRFESTIRSQEVYDDSDLEREQIRTKFIDVQAKSIVNKVDSPDIPYKYSINPYQGCEHGCVYCYARNSHNYWGYSAGFDFESKILIKKDAPMLLDKTLSKKSWTASPIMMSGNTDCYQSAERKYKISRSLLKVFRKHHHPVGIITKNQLLLRDLDLLRYLNERNLVKVAVSINTLDDSIRRKLEPRASSIPKRIKLVKTLVKNNIPVNVLMAPIIPSLNDHDLVKMVKVFGELGVNDINYILVRLNGDIAAIFSDWLKKCYPDRADKILNKIKSTHGGQMNDSRYGRRMKGEGNYAEIIGKQFKVAKKKYFQVKQCEYNLDMYGSFKNPQLSLFN